MLRMNLPVPGHVTPVVLNDTETAELDNAIEGLFNMCKSLRDRGNHVAAYAFGRVGDKLVKQRYPKGQAGFHKFEMFLGI